MGYGNSVGTYQLGRTIGEGTFAKVKLGVNSTNGHHVAIKIVDKDRVMQSDLKNQVQREIRTMKLLHHPNIVQIHEVIGTKTKIYMVMEYISGGQLADKLSYAKKLSESEARKIFHQLIDTVDYCHNRGVYHRDLKPENLLLDAKGNLKVSDFGLSALHKVRKACANYLSQVKEITPLIMCVCAKISTAEYACPQWFTKSQKKLISRILEPNPRKRITIPEIIEDEWFQIDYMPSCGYECDEKIFLDDVNAAFDADEEDKKQKTRLGSEHTVNETIRKIKAAAMDVSLSVERMTNSKMKMHPKLMMKRRTRSYYDLSAEVIEVAPMNCVVEISKSVGELRLYKEFCKSLSSLLTKKSELSLTKKSEVSLPTQGSENEKKQQLEVLEI
ncbi:unnamed protein product [Dovyalis caffra]|uniref:Protein kinase domain-containing protein n=1 Tax=Dovyalis caffra TaxID=77055 RepID=A0AAV1S1I0_9ROSI|nr:unnamed protein product [Dovyalis caffra]